jgi:mono/diheme cytochrome c family protein
MAAAGRTLAATGAGALLISLFSFGAAAHDRITTKVTWDREIAPIFQARCVECHTADRTGAIALSTYQQARPWAAAIKEEVLTRRMPTWHAARGYGDFTNDPSLSPFEIALIAAWVDGGAPETDKAAGTPRGGGAPGISPGKTAPGLAATHKGTRVRTLACLDQAVSGRLLAVSPRLEKGASVGIAVRRTDGHQEIVAWIRDYDPRSPATYWLRRPLALPPGSLLIVESTGACTIAATFAR